MTLQDKHSKLDYLQSTQKTLPGSYPPGQNQPAGCGRQSNRLQPPLRGRQVFGVNDTRMERLARLFGRGNDQDYRIAAMALEDFASGGHATLAKNVPTYIVT